MYLDYYRLQRAPFPLTPDPTLRFVSPSHQRAMDALTQGIAARQGLVVLTGVPGVGKTMLVHAYLAGGAPPLTWLVNGAPVGAPELRRQAAWRPDGAGFARISVVDAQGATDSVLVRIE